MKPKTNDVTIVNFTSTKNNSTNKKNETNE